MNPTEPNPETAPRKSTPLFQRPVLVLALSLIAITAILAGTTILLRALSSESTDDAFVDGQIIAVAPKVAGKVADVSIRDNQAVRKGDPLVKIDPADFESVVAQKKAALAVSVAQQQSAEAAVQQAAAHVRTVEAARASARASVDAAEAMSKRQHGDLKRNRELVATGAISTQDFEHSSDDADSAQATREAKAREVEAADAFLEEATTQTHSAQAQQSASAATVEKARRELDQAELQLSYTRINAPADGRVTSKSVEPGSYVQVGQSLLAIVPGEVWITANFKESQIGRMRPGQSATVVIDAEPGKSFRARVDSIQAGSGARFSMLPPENATGNYVKVVQRIPVKLVLDEKPDVDFIPGPGMSAVPRVQVGEAPGTRKTVLLLATAACAAVVIVAGLRLATLRKS